MIHFFPNLSLIQSLSTRWQSVTNATTSARGTVCHVRGFVRSAGMNGKSMGKKDKLQKEHALAQIRMMRLKQRMTDREICEAVKISRATLYRYKREIYKEDKALLADLMEGYIFYLLRPLYGSDITLMSPFYLLAYLLE